MSQALKGSIISVLTAVALLGSYGIVAASSVTVMGNTSSAENSAGWMFNRDTSTQSPFSFNLGNASVGIGSLYVEPITNGINGISDKFIAEDFLLTPIANLNKFSADYKFGSGVSVSDADQFYMNVYANFGTSSPTKYYDCRYDVIASTGSDSNFTTLTFDPTLSYPVTTRGTAPFTCPSIPRDMDTVDTSASSTIRDIAISVGDTSGSDTGISGYLDNVVVSTTAGDTSYDFEPDTSKLVSNSEGEYYLTIQDAVTGTADGGTITVPAGTYDSFSVAGRSNLTIHGAGAGSTVISPTTLVDTGVAHKYLTDTQAVVFVDHSTNVALDGMTINSNASTPGAGGPDAIVFWNASTGTIKNSAVTGVYTINGMQTGQGIAVDASGADDASLTVDSVAISGFQKNGIEALNGNGAASGSTGTITLTVKDSAITGAGATSAIAQNGVVVWNRGGGTVAGTIDSSTVTGFSYTGADTAAGVLAYGGGEISTIRKTNFSNNQLNISTTAGSPAIDASKNYWGGSAPDAATLDGSVSSIPWYTDAAMTTLRYPTTSDTNGNQTVTVDDQTSLTGTTLTAAIPAGTTVTGDASWDGTIMAPTASTTITSVPVNGFTTTVVSAIAIGSNDSDLTFDKAVRLVFSGEAGKKAGWYNHDGVFDVIDHTCADDTQGGNNNQLDHGVVSCSIDVGSDLVVWTKHFSTFVTYTQTAVTTGNGNGNGNGGGNSGGGGGGGNGAPSGLINVISTVLPTTPASQTAIIATTNAAVNQNGRGQVLGAAAYNFAVNLTVGSKGTDVTELQKILIAQGDLSIDAPTGYFGSLTKAAVVKYQTAHAVSPTSGYVGPLTRAQLNKGTTPTMTDEAKSVILATLLSQVKALQAQLTALMASSTASTTLSGTVY